MSYGGGGAANQRELEALQQSLNQVVLQLLQNQVRKTCFEQCFPGNRFPSSMGKTEHVCLAKCMDRMYEAHAIVMKASVEMAQNLASQERG
mmetsp:Transcript_121516/g.388764  ORF Transcript_121516/g.388764 Transcript_121516/m.388764 type:complete len:91 (-) Transcript_121516:233-505(-)